MIRAVAKGDPIVLPTADGSGWKRQPAPCDGVMIEDSKGSFAAFVPLKDVVRALRGRWKR